MVMEPGDSTGDPMGPRDPLRPDESGREDAVRGNHACRRAAETFERLIDGDLTQGDPDVVEAAALKDHLASCEACRDLYALDLALIESIRTAPAVAFESVASAVVREVRAKERRSLVLRWAPIVGVVSWVGMIAVVYGRSALESLVELLTGGLETSPLLEGLSRVGGVGLKLLDITKSLVIDIALDSGVSAYAPEMAVAVLLAGALVIFMMYGMGIWLGKPREVRSWHRS